MGNLPADDCVKCTTLVDMTRFILGFLLLVVVPFAEGFALRRHAPAPTPARHAVKTARRRATISMPSLVVHTNVKLPDASGLCKALSSTVATSLSKPESYVLVSIQETTMAFGGDTATPTAFVYLSSLGSINPETNKATSAAIASLLESELGVPAGRYYINFYDSPRPNCGFNGGTF